MGNKNYEMDINKVFFLQGNNNLTDLFMADSDE